MVKSKSINLIMVGLVLTIIPLGKLAAQFNKEYPLLKKYSKFSLIAGPAIYDKGTTSRKYGDYTFENYPMLGFNAGFGYDFQPERKWSLVSGFLVALEPIYKIKYRIYEKDLFSDWEGDMVDRAICYAITSFSVPLLVRLNIQSGKNSFINFNTGFKGMYFPQGTQELGILINSEKLMETREIFGLKAETQDQNYYGSYIIGTGFSYATEKLLLKSNLLYVMNFQNTFEGEYLFGNLEQSGDSRGTYNFSGNYLAMLFSVSLKKQKQQ